ncbi:hypothetical protein [Shewanella gaetbuli]|uniref:Uncharacterized protein n=1 Tax=Shewanella gaetbuli TaxID=220752 RepID=A0A9X1ZKK5_9GAMM|nr:hypothetical protein [Shewanella gaetbuli]MCL1142692.1 hypothetical protein [Shewanella gaetbuli]
MRTLKLLLSTGFIIALGLFITGCTDDTAEDAGEKIDEIVTDAGNAVEDACEEVKEGLNSEDPDC